MIFAILIILFVFVGTPILVVYLLGPDAITEIFKKSPKYNVQDEMSLFNDAEWVKKVILSCKNTNQIWKAYKLSENLRNKYRNKVNNETLLLVSDEISKIFNNHHHKLTYK